MPKILELKAAEAGCMWVKVEMPGPQGALSILSEEEIRRIKRVAQGEILKLLEFIVRDPDVAITAVFNMKEKD